MEDKPPVVEETSHLPPKAQEFYNENRERYGGVTDSLDIKRLSEKCIHYFDRLSWSKVECKHCHMGLIDNSRFMLENGQIIGVK